jgi:hypothetical protein
MTDELDRLLADKPQLRSVAFVHVTADARTGLAIDVETSRAREQLRALVDQVRREAIDVGDQSRNAWLADVRNLAEWHEWDFGAIGARARRILDGMPKGPTNG